MSEPAAFDGFNGELGSPLSGGKRKKGNGHKASCGCPICNNMRKNKKGGVLLVGGEDENDSTPTPDTSATSDTSDTSDTSAMGKGGGRRRRRSRSRSRSKSRSRSSRKSMQGGKKRKSKRRR